MNQTLFDQLRRHWVLALAGLLALGIRLAYIAEIRPNPFFDAPYIDAREYDASAWILAHGGQPPESSAQAPLYPLFLSLLYRLRGHDYLFVRLVQAVIGTANVLLIATLAARTLDPATGRLAALFAAIYWPFVFFEAELHREPLAIHTILASLCILISVPTASRPGTRSFLAGLVLGVGALVRENVLLFVPFAAFWLRAALIRRGTPRSQSLAAALLLVLGVSLALLPVCLNHSLEQGEPVLVSTQGGLNFYIGNHPDMRKLTGLQPGAEWQSLLRLPDQEIAEPNPARRSRWFYCKAIETFRQNPAGWLARSLEKAWLFTTAQELLPNHDLEFYRKRSLLLSLLTLNLPDGRFPFGLLAPLAVLGFFISGRREDVRLLRLFLLTYMLSVVLFHVRSRYRLPAVPVILMFSSSGVFGLMRAWQEGESHRTRILLAAFGLAALFVNLPLFDVSWARRFSVPFHLGLRQAEKGRLDEAEGQFRQALALQPDLAEAHLELGRLNHRKGLVDEAEGEFRKALALHPDDVRALFLLGRLQAEQGRRSEAEGLFRQALGIDRRYAPALAGIAALRIQEGALDQAIQFLEEAARLDPERATIHLYLGDAKTSAGRIEEAVLHFRTALHFNPFLLEARLHLTAALESLGRPEEAREQRDKARALGTEAADVQRSLQDGAAEAGH
ncbi:MAG: tetratricopeptide repeat protein [Planctomycetes bacterium]|nr:tetratricopeptide repeat protein [Planctomycetota bacterium]